MIEGHPQIIFFLENGKMVFVAQALLILSPITLPLVQRAVLLQLFLTRIQKWFLEQLN